MSEILVQLRAATRPIHERLELLPYHVALTSGELSQFPAINYLRSLATLHEALESVLAEQGPSEVSEIFRNCEPKLAALISDLTKVSPPNTTFVPTTARSFSSSIRGKADDPFYLAGVLYVLEGSQNGGVMLKQLYAKALGVKSEDLAYFGYYGPATGPKWRAFTQNLSTLIVSASQRESLIEGALDTFKAIEKIFLDCVEQ